MVLLFQRNENLIQLKQLHSTKPELRFCAVLNTTRGVSVIRDGEDLWQWPRLEIRLNAFRRSTIPQKQLIIIIIIIISTTRPNLPPIAFKLVSNKLMALILPLSKYDGWTYPLLTWSYGVLSKWYVISRLNWMTPLNLPAVQFVDNSSCWHGRIFSQCTMLPQVGNQHHSN